MKMVSPISRLFGPELKIHWTQAPKVKTKGGKSQKTSGKKGSYPRTYWRSRYQKGNEGKEGKVLEMLRYHQKLEKHQARRTRRRGGGGRVLV